MVIFYYNDEVFKGEVSMIKNIIGGIAVGIANVIPGVSGGTMMVILGLTEQLGMPSNLTNGGAISKRFSKMRGEFPNSALLRAGRFDREIHVDLPGLNERKAIFLVHLKCE